MKSLNDFTDADRRSHTNREPPVYYAFDPGPFSRALLQALKNSKDAVVVVVEEVNRGNCAAIFGDVFQLLDRVSDDKPADERGRSEYPIVPSAEWKAWLDEQLDGVVSPCWAGGHLRLPGNLYLYATMNTSDPLYEASRAGSAFSPCFGTYQAIMSPATPWVNGRRRHTRIVELLGITPR